MRHLAPILVLVLGLVAGPGHALADKDETAILIDGTWLKPRDGYAASAGMGAELRFVVDNEPFTMSLGGFATLGQQGASGRGRDVFDVHFQVGAKLFGKRMRALAPYVGLGLDVLHITTHEPGMELRGTTLGVMAVGGFMGSIGDRIVYRATVGYLGAIVPGTGDDLGGLVFQLGVGARLDD